MTMSPQTIGRRAAFEREAMDAHAPITCDTRSMGESAHCVSVTRAC